MALIPLNTFKTKTAVLTTAEYNSKTCARDTGLIIDSIAFDLLYGYQKLPELVTQSTQSTFAGLQYWAQDAIKIPGDVLQTLAALDHAKEISKKIVVNIPISFSIGYDGPSQIVNTNNYGGSAGQQKIIEEYDLISKIIENGTKGITDLIIPNEHDVKNIAITWTAETDYKYGTIIKTQIGTITKYYKVIKAGKSGATNSVFTSNNKIINDNTVTFEYIQVNNDYYNSAALLLANKELIEEEVTTYVINNFNKLYNKDSLIKNTRLIIDSLAFDLLFNGSSQSKFAGLQYWNIGTTTKIPLQVNETIASIERMKEITLQVVKNELVSKSLKNSLDQYTDPFNAGNSDSIEAINTLYDLIINILENGSSSAIDLIVPNSQITTLVGLLNAYKLIQENKLFIQEEIIAWIDDQIEREISPFTNDYPFEDITKREKCYRDTGYILDCISFDLIYTSINQANRQTIQAGIYYYNRTTLSVTPTEQSQLITIFNYLKSLINEIITAKSIAVTYQSDIKQLINLPAATEVQTNFVISQFNLITDIIEKGPSIVTKVEPISLLPSNNEYDSNGFRLLLANKDFLVAEAVAFISNLTESDFNLSNDRLLLCKRDIGYIVDSIVFDLKHSGNRQAIHCGVYYYDHSAKINVIPRERIDTTEAYNYMRTVIESVLKNETLSTTYQSAIKQYTNLEPITTNQTIRNNIINASRDLISKINSIINSGPSVLTPAELTNNKKPISLEIVPVIDSPPKGNELVKAFNILLANREYIIAEVIGYLNTKLLTRPNTTKIYTAPPGVTAIILMAQAANVTDTEIDVTFAHYRNIPVFADPATYNGYQAANTVTELVKDFTIPPKNAATLIDGKMIIESFDSVIAYATVNEGIKITLSILETANA